MCNDLNLPCSFGQRLVTAGKSIWKHFIITTATRQPGRLSPTLYIFSWLIEILLTGGIKMKLQDTWAVTQHDTHGFWHWNRNISISISHRCHPLWFKQKPAEQRASERTSNTPTVRGFPFKTRPGKTFWTAPQRNPDYSTMPLSFSACNVKWMKMELQRSWSQSGEKREKRHKEDGLSRGSSLVKIEPRPLRGLVTAATKTNGRRRLWIPVKLLQAVIHHLR